MHRILMISCLGLLMAQSLAVDARAEATPRIRFDQMVYDAGSTSQLVRVTGAFVFRNEGTAPLHLEQPSTVCSCTQVRAEPLVVAPGESGKIMFDTDAAGAVGLKTSEITVKSNDPQNDRVKLTLKVNWIKEFDVQPSSVAVGPIGMGITTNITVTVTRTDGSALPVSSLGVSSDAVQAVLQPAPDKSNAEIVVTYTAKGEPRFAQEKVTVRGPTDDAVLVEIPVYAHVRQALMPAPQRLMWMVRDSASPQAERVIRITNFTPDQPLVLTELTSDVEGITLAAKPANADHVTEVVAMLARAPAETVTGTIRLTTNFPDQPVIEVPFKVNVLKTP